MTCVLKFYAGNSKVSIGFSEKKIVVSENSGTINDELFIEISGQIEPTVSVKITSGSGVLKFLSNFFKMCMHV